MEFRWPPFCFHTVYHRLASKDTEVGEAIYGGAADIVDLYLDIMVLVSAVTQVQVIRGLYQFGIGPFFAEASQLVRGADADVILDDTLIEIKTVMKCQLLSKYLHELAGYYCLYRIGGVIGVSANKPLRRLGIYFARHGYLYTVPVTECWGARDFKTFLRWFEDLTRARA